MILPNKQSNKTHTEMAPFRKIRCDASFGPGIASVAVDGEEQDDAEDVHCSLIITKNDGSMDA